MHQRAVIRHAVRDLLIAAATVAGSRVFATRAIPLRENQLPAICIYTLTETVDAQESITAPRVLTRDLSVVIEGWAAPGDNVDDSMDALALEIENAMHADPYLGDVVADSMLDDTTMEVLEEGARIMGLVTLTYAATYRTFAPEPDAGLDDFNTAGVTHNLAGEQDAEDTASDEFTVQESA
jgi:hypothetical protein